MQTIKVLILEDNAVDAVLMQHELRNSELSFNSVVVQTRGEFETALHDFLPDLILSDYSLPSFDGVTAFHIAKRTRDVPFIIVSGTIGEENAVELIKNGVTDYVLKDKIFTLIHKIKRALKECREKKEKTLSDVTLQSQNEKLFEIAFLQSHKVRVPVAHILGLSDLFRADEPANPINSEIIGQIKEAAKSLDKIIHEIVLKTGEMTGKVTAA